jgi:hypothetical protein
MLLHYNDARCSSKEHDRGNLTNELASIIQSTKSFDTHGYFGNQTTNFHENFSFGTLSYTLKGTDILPLNNVIASKQLYNTSDVHIFFILTPNISTVLKYKERYENVRTFISEDSHAKYFTALYWETHWSTIKNIFKSFRLPNSKMPELKGTRNRRGKYARWVSVLLAVAYAVQFRLPHIVLLEDDSKWPTGNAIFYPDLYLS